MNFLSAHWAQIAAAVSGGALQHLLRTAWDFWRDNKGLNGLRNFFYDGDPKTPPPNENKP